MAGKYIGNFEYGRVPGIGSKAIMVKVGGVWTPVSTLWVKAGGAWKAAAMSAKVGGVWKS